MKLSEAYDKMVANKNIPKEITAPVFKIMNDCSRGKYTEQQAIEEVQRLMNAMQASANYLINMLKEWVLDEMSKMWQTNYWKENKGGPS